MTKTTKLRAQVKSRWYYYFWGAATIAVVTGQIYVGNGFRRMARSFDRLVNGFVIELLQEEQKPRGRYEPLIPPPKGDFRDFGPGLTQEIDPDDYIIWLEVDDSE